MNRMKIPKKLDNETFAMALQLHRSRLGYTQGEAAKTIRVSLRTWINWEKNTGEPSYPAMLGALAILKFARVKKKP